MNTNVEWYDENIPEFDDVGDFSAVITGTSEKSAASNWRGVSACVAEVEQLGPKGVRRRLIHVSEAANSHEARAYVAAVASVVEALMPGSSVAIYCRNKFIVDALNDWLAGWAANQWNRSNGKPVAAKEIWSQVHNVITERHIDVRGVWVGPSDGRMLRYVEQLLNEARDHRQNQTAKLEAS